MTLLNESKPAKESEAQLHFSYSQLNTYLICPQKYHFQYVIWLDWETKPIALPFGKAIHKSAETYYLNLLETGEIIPAEHLIAVFESTFDQDIKNTDIELTFKNGENLESLREQGIELLKLFHAETNPQKIVAVEFRFSVGIPDIFNGGEDLPIKLLG
mgnify:CR=1 FL=1